MQLMHTNNTCDVAKILFPPLKSVTLTSYKYIIRTMSESKPIVYYWGGVKSRTFYMGMALACTGNSDNVSILFLRL